jgi:hypothetical protein
MIKLAIAASVGAIGSLLGSDQCHASFMTGGPGSGCRTTSASGGHSAVSSRRPEDDSVPGSNDWTTRRFYYARPPDS